MSVGDTIKRLRLSHKLSQGELGKIAGVTDKAVSTWEKGEKVPRMGAIEKMAAYFGVSKGYLIDGKPIEKEDLIPPGFEPLPRMVKKPLVGSIACGEPILAEENIEDYVDIPENVHCDFCLRCKGQSMIDAGIQDGDIVYIHKQEEVENGEIAAVRIEGEATLKHVHWDAQNQTLMLIPANSSMLPRIYSGEAINSIHIEGKAVGFTHWF